jgi:hypothetical protein
MGVANPVRFLIRNWVAGSGCGGWRLHSSSSLAVFVGSLALAPALDPAQFASLVRIGAAK